MVFLLYVPFGGWFSVLKPSLGLTRDKLVSQGVTVQKRAVALTPDIIQEEPKPLSRRPSIQTLDVFAN